MCLAMSARGSVLIFVIYPVSTSMGSTTSKRTGTLSGTMWITRLNSTAVVTRGLLHGRRKADARHATGLVLENGVKGAQKRVAENPKGSDGNQALRWLSRERRVGMAKTGRCGAEHAFGWRLAKRTSMPRTQERVPLVAVSSMT